MAVRPLKDGVIADFDITATMLKHFIRKAVKSTTFSKPNKLRVKPAITATDKAVFLPVTGDKKCDTSLTAAVDVVIALRISSTTDK